MSKEHGVASQRSENGVGRVSKRNEQEEYRVSKRSKERVRSKRSAQEE